MDTAKSHLIYVLDDDEAVRDSIAVLLETEHFRVMAFANLAELLGSPFDRTAGCILLDQNMPGMTGLQVIRFLRRQKIETPAILLTANGDRIDVRAASVGVLAVLRKPVADEELLKWVREACSKSPAARDT